MFPGIILYLNTRWRSTRGRDENRITSPGSFGINVENNAFVCLSGAGRRKQWLRNSSRMATDARPILPIPPGTKLAILACSDGQWIPLLLPGHYEANSTPNEDWIWSLPSCQKGSTKGWIGGTWRILQAGSRFRARQISGPLPRRIAGVVLFRIGWFARGYTQYVVVYKHAVSTRIDVNTVPTRHELGGKFVLKIKLFPEQVIL